jgi:hypothetical protein
MAQVALVATLGPRVTGWLGLFAVGAVAWATFYLVRTFAAMLTPEEEEFLQRLFAATLPWLKRGPHHRTPR